MGDESYDGWLVDALFSKSTFSPSALSYLRQLTMVIYVETLNLFMSSESSARNKHGWIEFSVAAQRVVLILEQANRVVVSSHLWGDCGSGGRTGCPITKGLTVQVHLQLTVLGQDILPTLPHISVSGCTVAVVGEAIWRCRQLQLPELWPLTV